MTEISRELLPRPPAWFKSARFNFFFIFIFSLLTHLPGLTSPILDFHGWAQTLRASIARNYYEKDMNLLNPQVDYIDFKLHNETPQFPLHSYLIAILYRMFGFNDVWGRVVSIFFAALSAGFLYLLSRKLYPDSVAFASALIFCVIPLRIYFMRAVMPESMAICSLILGFYCTMRWLESEQFFLWGLPAALALALTALLKLPYVILLLPAFYLLYEKWGVSAIKKKETLFFIFLILVLFLSWYIYINYGIAKEASFFERLVVILSLFKQWSTWNYWEVQFLSRFPELLTTYAGLLFFFVGVRASVRDRKRFIMGWFLATLLYLLLCGEYARIHVYALIPFAPINAILIAVGLDALWVRWHARKGGAVLLIVLVISIPVHAALRIRHWYKLDDLWVVQLKEKVDQLSKPEDLFYVNAHDQPFFLYHIHRRGYVRPLSECGLEYLDEAIRGGAKYFFSPTREDWEHLKPYFKERYRPLYEDQNFVLYDLTAKAQK